MIIEPPSSPRIIASAIARTLPIAPDRSGAAGSARSANGDRLHERGRCCSGVHGRRGSSQLDMSGKSGYMRRPPLAQPAGASLRRISLTGKERESAR